ncbi:SCO family protein [Sphingopyxis sp. BSN-002]|uniref:SCO family protein n=1 Tax=Sphingopyxis sp. BSN-002 TaxID=2911495 RepID=UPI001EDB491C|nr:SCO family protein [Sphingopyxis sp. BSN-002]UKK82922.1 SCO family protein [Sphingopyxis sp. BSN-002]
MMNIDIMGQKLARSSLLLILGAMLAGCNPSGGASTAEPPLADARIGGPFTLTDQDGRTVRDTDFAGKYRLVYFGYSFCPDICPVDLQKLMRGLSRFEKEDPARGAKVVPMFITVDPERDTPAALKPFVNRYHPRLLGLTGTPEQIAAVAKAYAVIYNKVPGSAPDRYLMAHSQLAFLMDPQGKPVALLPLDNPSTDPDEGAPDKVAAELAKWVR